MARTKKAATKKSARAGERPGRSRLDEIKRRNAANARRLKQIEKELARARAELERERKAAARARKERAKRRVEGAAQTKVTRTRRADVGRTTHVKVREPEGEPQYAWRELEERSAPVLKRRKKGPRRWARLVVEMSPSSIMKPDQYRKLRGAPVIRTRWMPPEDLVSKVAPIVDQLQQSGAVVPSMKIVVVESPRKPPRKLF